MCLPLAVHRLRHFLCKNLVASVNTLDFTTAADNSTNLKDVLAKKIPAHNKKVVEFRKNYGPVVLQQLNIDMIYNGLRSVKGLVTETSELDPEEGIRFRGYSIADCQKLLPRSFKGEVPLPEGMWWLLCTGDIPSDEQVRAVSKEWAARADLPDYIVKMLTNFPSHVHPMAQFVSAIAALNSESEFSKAYHDGVHKSTYWEYIYEDSTNLLAKLPTIAAVIYKNLYRHTSNIGAIDPDKDWSANFCSMLGYDNPQFTELMRLYLTIHSDHEGGNVSAHTCHLVGSALSDPFLSFSAAMAGLAGPLHGLANQKVLIFLFKIIGDLGHNYTEKDLCDWIWKFLKSGQVIPGYGHAVLRRTDPRYICQREFALKHLAKDKMFELVSTLYKIVPDILLEQGKVSLF